MEQLIITALRAAHAAGRAEGLEAADKAVEAARDGLRDAGWGAGADVALSAIRALK